MRSAYWLQYVTRESMQFQGLDYATQMLLVHMCLHCGKDGTLQIKQDDLAKIMGCHRRTIMRRLKKIESIGLIKSHKSDRECTYVLCKFDEFRTAYWCDKALSQQTRIDERCCDRALSQQNEAAVTKSTPCCDRALSQHLNRVNKETKNNNNKEVAGYEPAPAAAVDFDLVTIALHDSGISEPTLSELSEELSQMGSPDAIVRTIRLLASGCETARNPRGLLISKIRAQGPDLISAADRRIEFEKRIEAERIAERLEEKPRITSEEMQRIKREQINRNPSLSTILGIEG